MSDHLPECTLPKGWGDCICTELRACEQRVERRIDFMLAKANDYGERTGYIAGVRAARDAVAALLGWQHGIAMTAITKADALDAIDALRGGS